MHTRTRTVIRLVLLLSVSTAALRAQTLYVPSGTSGIGSSSNGNVGIGTASPAQKLMIQAGHGDTNVRLFSDNFGQGIDGANSAILSLWASEPGWTWNGAGIGNNVVNSGGIVRVTTTRGGSYMRLLDNQIVFSTIDVQGTDRSTLTLSSGSVGIGTANPGYTLDVNSGSANIAQQLFGTNGQGTLLHLGNSNSGTSWNIGAGGNNGWANDSFVIDQHGVGQRLIINSSGNVGIGTTSPAKKLHIAGEIQISGQPTSSRLYFGDNDYTKSIGTENWWMTFRGHGNEGWKFIDDTGDVIFQINGLGANNGNVGIGTTNPTQKLSVNGTVRAKEVIVDTGWSDYVFAQNYRLAPLTEVETHIKTEGHLPGIPSAQEVAERGISLGEMQSKLLAKIEELTLHQIAQEKRIAKLEAENAALRAK